MAYVEEDLQDILLKGTNPRRLKEIDEDVFLCGDAMEMSCIFMNVR